MDFRLQAFKRDQIEGRIGGTIRFAVLDYHKSKSYPSNFVCMLPLKMQKGKVGNVFIDVFGDKSLDIAMGLLKDALKRENDFEVKTELERRLKLIDPQQVNQVKCGSCGKQYQPYRIKRFKQNLCQECLNKRYRSRQQ
jgi:hypothetical protein